MLDQLFTQYVESPLVILFIGSRDWEGYGNSQAVPLLINGLKKMWYLYTTEFYSATKHETLSWIVNGWNWRTSS
jgi:hypothetical protein